MHPLIYVPRRSLVVPDRAPRRLGCGVGCGVGGSPSPWTPAALAALSAWWRGDKGVTLAGAGVASWDGGSGAIVSQATAARQPTMSTLNGAPALAFDRTVGQRLISGVLGAPLMGQKDWTIFCAIKSTSATLQQYITMVGNRSLDGYGVGIRADSAHSTRQVLASSVDFWQAGASTTNAEIWVVRCTAAGVRTMRVNGADDPMVSAALPVAPSAMVTIGSQNDTATGTFGGLIAEVGVIAAAVAGDDLTKLEAYLRGRYGV